MSTPGIPDALNRIIQLLAKFPGIGEKTALRHAIFLVQTPELSTLLGPEMATLHKVVGPCPSCNGLSATGELCAICDDHKRDPHILCVVHRVEDIIALEQCGAMRGSYFVLGKVMSPLEGVSGSDLPCGALMRRIAGMSEFLRGAGDEKGLEVLFALSPSVDGEATGMYLQRFVRDTYKKMESTDLPKFSVFNSGVPYGGDISYANRVALQRAFEDRKAL